MENIKIGEFEIAPGESRQIELQVSKLYTNAPVSLPVHIFRSKKPGPVVFVSAAVHGDELNGIEIIRRLISQKNFKITCGTLIVVPMVNVYGVVTQSRYMPDRRDLNRSFPGSAKGSLAGRVAHIFMTEIIKHCDFGIDLHTGAIHRSNLPQIRADLSDAEVKELAEVFGVSVVLNSEVLEGSLRESAFASGTKVLLYEAGEALRFDELSIRAGLKGILNVLQHLKMIRKQTAKKRKVEPFIANNSSWTRANASGIVNNLVTLGDHVQKNQLLAKICGPFGDILGEVLATRGGIVIGKQNIPLAQEGEAMFHIASFEEDHEDIAEQIETANELLLPEDEGLLRG
ncbi:deacylase [Psychrosphaera saromensis]|uniref:Succinylglutamate desuccinylase n=1 Tax=Psychrosphaera saromensis TaxID=716813 RepID=A0A2S7UTT3_9GAMM|nr:succinylglutamate desuccinylase/aspartoacylase family protein [Psychrosphaera saromensis]PQJ53353.1 succinylglutamate desuccinylase [Psychrosphaera saromensis]GHB66184.1 deacylase [Psychrosphaera saromensis]GLQ14871.1 deacylase [Psychrosphaera saromensis]